MTLAEMAAETRLSLSTARFYERIGLIRPIITHPEPRYGEVARLRLQVIQKGQRLGLGLENIRRLMDERQHALRLSREGEAKACKTSIECDRS